MNALVSLFNFWASLEAAFYLFVYLPRKAHLQKPAKHPATIPRERRRELFRRCLDHVTDPEAYLRKWFLDCPASEIKRDNIKDFLRWALFNSGDVDPVDDEELEEYIEWLEKLQKVEIPPGRGNSKCLRLTLDDVEPWHRPLAWYMIVSLVDTITFGCLIFASFDFYRSPLSRFFTLFPFRPIALVTRYRSPVKHLTYWHRPHTSRTKLPILFIHGIGIGLWPYTKFLTELNSSNLSPDSDGDIGIIALEIMPVCFRITFDALEREEMCAEIQQILSFHGWEKFMLVSHSYGSVISTHLLQMPNIAPMIGPCVFIDPVCFLLHLPYVAYNFVYRKPKGANEHQLHFFASKDIGVAHTLSRRFFWSENILWKEDLKGRPVTVVLGGKDLIVNTEEVGAYLTNANFESRETGSWKSKEWTGDGIDVVWFQELDHAQMFDSRPRRAMVIDIIRDYSTRI